ncbi:MAG: YHS domain-containing protein [Gemmatimonadetes bacterium]|nr:YHS domain-containing protein [Gemmatimonadota bacterium]
MAQVKDPVCGMMIDSDKAAAKSSYQEQTYYFCAESCKRTFDANPGKYAQAGAAAPAAAGTGKAPSPGMGGKGPGAGKRSGMGPSKPKM